MSEAAIAERVEQLKSFYNKHNPDKVGDAETLIANYRFLDIVNSLLNKYGEDVLKSELPNWYAELANDKAADEELVKQLTAQLEQTSVEDFAQIKGQLEAMEACLAEGGADAARAKFEDFAPLNDDQVALAVQNMRDMVGLADTVHVGSKVGQPPEAPSHFTVTCQVEIPEGKSDGDTFSITLPNGHPIEITVPEGMNSGETMGVDVHVPADHESIFQQHATEAAENPAENPAPEGGNDSDDDFADALDS
jgi:hypothetical protein